MKICWKIPPVSVYDIPGLERWLSAMAEQGLYLKKFRPYLCTFRRDTPRPTRYRIEPHRRQLDEELPQSMLELYREFGWDYVTEIERTMLVFSTQDPEAPEVHTDLTVQSQLWTQLARRQRRSFWICLVLLAVLLLEYLYPLAAYWPDLPLTLLLVTPGFFAGFFILVICLAAQVSLFRQWRAIRSLSRRLEAGVALEQQSIRSPSGKLEFLIQAIRIPLVLLFLLEFAVPFFTPQYIPLDEFTAFSPLSLASVEGPGYTESRYMMGTYYSDERGDQQVDANNSCQPGTHSVLCWDRWTVVQTGQTDQNGRWPRMIIQWSDPVDPLAQPLARDLLRCARTPGDREYTWRYGLEEDAPWTQEEFPLSGGYLALMEQPSTGHQAVAAARNGKAVLVRYCGGQDLRDHLDEIVDMLN